MDIFMQQLPDFTIQSTGTASVIARQHGLNSFGQAVQFIWQLPYGRNTDKTKHTSLFADGCGTCSTKHAFLKQLAIDHHADGITLVIGLIRMNGSNTPAVAGRLKTNGLEYIPEAHCYLKIEGQVLDATWPHVKQPTFENDLLEEQEINPDQITDYKVSYQRHYLAGWLKANPQLNMSLEQLWSIREGCIRDLSNN